MMLGMGLYLFPTHTHLVYEQTQAWNRPDFLLKGGEEGASVHSLILLGPYSLDHLARNKFSLDISLKRCWISFHCAWGWI